MLIIIDKQTKNIINNMGTHQLFPDGNIPYLDELPETQEYVRLHDESDLAQKMKTVNKGSLVFDDDYNVVDVNIVRTNEQALEAYEASPEAIKHNILKELQMLDLEIPRIVEDIIEQGNFNIHKSKIDKINRKKELRLQLQSIT